MKSIIATTAAGVIMMMMGAFVKNKNGAATIAALLMTIVLGVSIWELTEFSTSGEPTSLFNDMLRPDRYTGWFNVLMTACTLLYIVLAGRHIRRVGQHVADYLALIFFILCGLYLLSSYSTLLMLFLGIEILSIPQYILAGSDRRNLKSSEASLKYFLMGSFSTGILLMGIAMLYGATGTFRISEFHFATAQSFSSLTLAGILLLLIGLGFKVSAAPMHLWTPDVYDGAPTPFTAFMSTVVKAAAFFAFLRLFSGAFGTLSAKWSLVLAIVTAATLLVGNVTAVFQQSVKRMLAYSSIAQAGFMLFAILCLPAQGKPALLMYAVAYSVATIGLFTVLMKLKDYTYDGFNGLGKRSPLLAFVTTIFVLSLAGIPLTGGFMAKYFVLTGLMQQGDYMWLIIFALVMAAVSVYYYFRVIWAMYFKEGEAALTEPVAMTDKLLLAGTAIIVIIIGVFPQLVMGWL